MPVGEMPVGEQQSVSQNAAEIHKGGSHESVSQHNVRATARDNTGYNANDTHPVPVLATQINYRGAAVEISK